MKKILCLLMAVLMISFVMASCTDNENADGDDTQGNGETVTETNNDTEDEYGDDDVVVAPDSWFQ